MTESKKVSDRRKLWPLDWTLFGSYSAFVIFMARLPSSEIPRFMWDWNDKAVHIAGYFLLFLLAWQAFQTARADWLRSRRLLAGVVYGALMGIGTEWMQHYVPGRSCDIQDWVADMIGTLGGAAILWGLNQKEKKLGLF